MMQQEVKQFLRTIETVKFHDGSAVEGYETDGGFLRFRAIRSDGHTEIDFQAVEPALNWAWQLPEEK